MTWGWIVVVVTLTGFQDIDTHGPHNSQQVCARYAARLVMKHRVKDAHCERWEHGVLYPPEGKNEAGAQIGG